MPTEFDLEFVGGPFDGAPGLIFVEFDGGIPLPEVLNLARCPGDGRCRQRRACRRAGHVWFCIPELEDVPSGSVPYELEPDSIEVRFKGSGRARYALGALPTSFVDREVVGVGGQVFGTVMDVNRDGRTVHVRLWEVI